MQLVYEVSLFSLCLMTWTCPCEKHNTRGVRPGVLDHIQAVRVPDHLGEKQ